MAASSDSAYLPSLDKCLGGEKILISWKLVSTTLPTLLTSSDTDSTSLREFLNDNEVINLLKSPLQLFPKPSQSTKTAFESKTSAVNVTPTSNGRYDIAEIRADTLWLSKKVEIDEVSALRIVVQEYQDRPSAQLLSSFSVEEATSLRDAIANTNTESSQLLQRTVSALTNENGSPDFGKEENRRSRCLQIYLSERRSFLSCVAAILGSTLHNEAKWADAGAQRWIPQLGRVILKTVQPERCDDFVSACVAKIDEHLGQLNGSGSLVEDNEEIEVDFLYTKLSEVLYLLEIIFQRVDSSINVPSSKMLMPWFELMTKYGFFDRIEFPHPTPQALVPSLQLFASTISSNILNSSRTLQYLRREDDSTFPEDDAYISTPDTVAALNDLFISAANMASQTASPAILSWAVLLQVLRQMALEQKEARETRQAQKAVEGFENESGEGSESRNLEGGAVQRRRSSVSSEASLDVGLYENIIEGVMDTAADGDPIKFLASVAVDVCHVYDVLIALANQSSSVFGRGAYAIIDARIRCHVLDIVDLSSHFVGYLPEVLEALLAALNGKRQYWQIVDGWQVHQDDSPAAKFWSSSTLISEFLSAASHRFPYEKLPFLKLLRALASYEQCNGEDHVLVVQWLRDMASFTHELPEDFRDYETTQEEDNTNTIRLLRTIQLFQRRKLGYAASRRGQQGLALTQQNAEFLIPEGTTGRIISDAGPRVALWFKNYSGLRYLGKLVQTALLTADDVEATTGEPADRESVAEIIQLLATLLETTSNVALAEQGPREAWQRSQEILEEASDGLDRNQDIVSVIFDLFRGELDLQAQADSSDLSMDLLIACLQFMHALIPFFPARVWPFLAKSGLLNLDGNGNRLVSIVGRIEMVTGRYRLLTSCVRIYQSLVDDCVRNAAVRMTRKTGSSAQFHDWDDLGSGVPERTLETVISAFTLTFVDVFESSCNWRYIDDDERMLLNRLLADCLNSIIENTYGIDDAPTEDSQLVEDRKPASQALVLMDETSYGSETKLIGALLPASKIIIENFLSTMAAGLKLQPIMRALVDGTSPINSSTSASTFEESRQTVTAILTFTESVVRAGILLEKPTSQLEGQLFKATPLIIRLYASHNAYRLPVVTLLDAIITGASRNTEEPPSLLGHLGSKTSKTFLDLLANLDKPLQNDVHFLAVWHLLTAIVSNRQQWFAIYLLTGRNPRESLKDTDKKAPSTTQPLLQIAMDYLAKIKERPLPKVTAVLQFVSSAQNFWSWAMHSFHKNKDLLSAITSFLADLTTSIGQLSSTPSSNITKAIDSSYRIRIAAFLADILTMRLFHTRNMGEKTELLDSTIKSLDYLFNNAVAEPSFNTSLHGNLKRNFQSRFKGCTLLHFKRSGLVRKQFGSEYFYNIQLADKMLGASQAWTGRKNDGLAKELEMANVNLSVVDAQVALLTSWKYLAVELSKHLARNNQSALDVLGAPQPQLSPSDQTMTTLARKLALIISDALVCNARSQHNENIFGRLAQTRADLALVLLQRLIERKWYISEVRKLLKISWETIASQDLSYEKARASNNLTYYRTLLKIVFLALCAHADGPYLRSSEGTTSAEVDRQKFTNDVSQTTLTILDHVVARGIREVATAAHEQTSSPVSEDLSLLTAVLQVSLRIPGIEFWYHQIGMIIEMNETARVATTLCSWADSLTINGDPIYGEPGMLFLLELSTVPVIAEQLAVQGVLGAIANANITTYLRRGIVSPVADSVAQQRCYGMWVRGILPFLLNLLHAVGASIAAEVALFLSQFPASLKSSAQSLKAPQTSRMTSATNEHAISYASVVEIRSIALLVHILSSFRTNLQGITAIPEVDWDAAGVYESVDYWLDQRAVLRDRILPMTRKELEWSKTKPRNAAASGAQNRLEEMVVEELQGIKVIIGGGEDA